MKGDSREFIVGPAAHRRRPGLGLTGAKLLDGGSACTSGAVLERITYADDETGYTIARVGTDHTGPDLLIVVGSLLGVQPGESLPLVGRWVRTPSTSANALRPRTREQPAARASANLGTGRGLGVADVGCRPVGPVGVAYNAHGSIVAVGTAMTDAAPAKSQPFTSYSLAFSSNGLSCQPPTPPAPVRAWPQMPPTM